MKLQTKKRALITLGLILFIVGCYYLSIKPIVVEQTGYSSSGTSSAMMGYSYRGYFLFFVGLLLAIRGVLLGKAPN